MSPVAKVAFAICLVIGIAGVTQQASAQTSSTGLIVGTVTDPSGSVIRDADVELRSVATNVATRARTNDAGQYNFANLLPGDYRVSVSAPGFSTAALQLKVEVGKSTLGDVALQVGQVGETVEVQAGARAELQTVDASIGDALGGQQITRLPTVQRNALELSQLQVGTLPATGTSGQYYGRGGAVSGVRGDQNSILVDGIDTTERFTSASRGMSSIDLPVDAIEEFRSTTVNPNAISGGASSGGSFSFATRRGSNDIHGAAYWYHQNDNLNANSWTRNRQGQANPELKDNRFGGRIGGPIFKDKTFFFGFYEGRRFPNSTDSVRIVPTESLRQGILRFRDGAGTIISYNLANSTRCGATGTLACDPRGIGISPLIKQYLTLYPVGNDPTQGDGLNTIGFRAPVDTSSESETAIGRIDHNFNSNWRLATSFIYQRQRLISNGQLELDPNLTGGTLLPLEGSPRDPRNVSIALTGQLSPTFINELRLGWNRQDFGTTASVPYVQVAAAGAPLDLATTLLDDPGDPPANRARPQFTKQRHWSVSDNATWTTGQHIIQFGFGSEKRLFYNARPDRLPLSTSPLANITAGSFVTIPAGQRPPTCSGSQANCLRSADVSRWNSLFGATLGIWDNTQLLVIRDGQGKPTGEPFASNESLSWHHEIRAMDTWRLNQSLTLNLGATVLLETPWADKEQREFFITNATRGELIRPKEFIRAKGEAAANGQILNVPIAYTPRESLGRKMYENIYKVSPRFGAAWNPSFTSGIMGTLFGDRKTVLRGGYSLLFDRIMATVTITSQISSNEILNSSASILAPTCTFAGTPGPNCVAGAPFRVGVDGAASSPVPAATITVPFVPQTRITTSPTRPFGVTAARAIDPDFGVGRVHGVNLTLQRELPGQLVMEVGWIGRYGRNLPGTFNLNAVPINLKDMSGLSSQTFAQAFDAVATELRRGVVAAQVTAQPWFENNFGANQTRAIAAAAASNFIAGQVGALFQNTLDPRLQALGKATVLNQQFDRMSWQTTGGWSNYDAFFASISKRMTKGLSLNANWTWSHGLDTSSNTADANGAAISNPYDFSFDYADMLSDVRHVFKVYGTYDLPFKRTNKVLGGWYTSFIFLSRTGLPISVTQGGDLFGSAAIFGSTTESVPGIGTVNSGSGVNSGVTGSGGVGTSSNPATGGAGLNLFADPAAVFANLRPFLLSRDTRSARGSFRGLGFWNLDASVGKSTSISENVNITFTADFFNLFNHTVFNDPVLSLIQPATFGVISSQLTGNASRGDFAGPRRIQFGLRVEF
jgi:carboxypeptidase family protein